jgi:hypothetical protein
VFVFERSPTTPGEQAPGSAALITLTARPSASKPPPSEARRRADPHALRAAAGGSRIPQPPPADPDVSDLGPIAPPAPATPIEPERKPMTGDGMREVGDALGATVQRTAGATDAFSAPLGPPVSEAVQKVLDLVTALLQGPTAAIGGTAATLR